jgi:hypothetical protein
MRELLLPRKVVFLIFAASIILAGPGAGAQNNSAAPADSSKQADSSSSASAPAHRQLSMEELWAKETEDLSTPSLNTSDFAPTNALTYERDEYDTFTREITRVGWRLGDPIDLYIMKPVGVKKAPVILYLYSYPFETDRFLNKTFCEFLTQNGFAAVGFATALTGQRYHERPMKEWFVSELRESMATSAHDVQLTLNYLATRTDLDLDTNNVGIFGDGSGASIAILAAGVDSRIKTLDLLDPWGDWPEWMAKSTLVPEKERAGFLTPEFLAGVAPLDPVKWLPELRTQKIRLQEVMSVTVTPDEAKRKVEAAAPKNAEVVRYQTAEEFRAAAAGQGFYWIKQQLQPTANAQYRVQQGGPQAATNQEHPSHP